MNDSGLFSTSDNSEVIYNQTKGDVFFSVSLGTGGFVNEDGFGTPVCGAAVIGNLSSCVSGEKRENYYLANDSCVDLVPENSTYDRCDYDGNNIIGFVSDIDSSFVVELYEGGNEINLSRHHNGTKSLEIYDGGDARVLFDYDYDFSPLDLTGIFLEKQGSNDDFGYLIVNGLAGEDKTIYIDNIMNDSNSVCVEDKEISSIGSISSDCGGSGEYIVDCDGGNSDSIGRVILLFKSS